MKLRKSAWDISIAVYSPGYAENEDRECWSNTSGLTLMQKLSALLPLKMAGFSMHPRKASG